MLKVAVMEESSRSKKVVSSTYCNNFTSSGESGTAMSLMQGLLGMLMASISAVRT